MDFRVFLRNKKAQETGGVTEPGKAARSILLGGFLILVVVSIMIKSSAIFASEGGQSTDETFRSFVRAFDKVAKGNSTKEMVPFSFSDDDHLIAVFDTRNPWLKDTCQSNENFKKPPECGNKICIVICDEDDACKKPLSKPVIIEKSKFGEVAVDTNFHANLGEKYGEGKEYPLIYSDCDGAGGEPVTGIVWVIIEAKENSYIFISDKACPNKKIGGKPANCIQGMECRPKTAPVADYKCSEGWTCCV